MICHTSNPWEGNENTSEFSVLHKMAYPLACFTILSPTIYTRFVLDGFRTAFSFCTTFLSFLLTSYWIVLEFLKVLVLFWYFLLILLQLLLLLFAILLENP